MNEIIDAQARTPEIIVGEIIATYNQVRRFALDGAIIIGTNLKELKELIPHGEWTDYIEDNLGMSARKAQQYIQLATEYGNDESPYYRALSAKPQLIADLSFTAALKLLTIPEEDLEEVVTEPEASTEPDANLEERIEEYKRDTERMRAQLDQVTAQMEMLRISASDVDKKNEEMDKLNSKAKKLEATIAKLEREKAEETKAAAEEARKKAFEEASQKADKEKEVLAQKAQEAEDRAARAERQLQNVSNETLARFKVHVDNLQTTLVEIKACILEVGQKEPGKADKMTTATWKLVNDILEAE